jgi:thiamine-phosphate pyrophosphorylase
MTLPRLYPIVDLGFFVSAPDPVLAVLRFTESLLAAGVTIIQLRDKTGDVRRFLSCARELRRTTRGRAIFIVNDRADICLAADADGVHLGQDDPSPESVRGIFRNTARAATAAGKPAPELVIGYSTHSVAQVTVAGRFPVDYIAVGPVYATASKANPDPVIGLEGVRQARAAAAKPLVAIGGITRQNCRQAIEAGAHSVAVISDLLDSPVKAVEQFMGVLE